MDWVMVWPSLGKGLLMSAGVLSVGLGAAGIFLPLLPTTPFLLLAAACFVRSSDRLYHWLISHKWFGHYIRNYREHRAIPLRSKIIVLVMLWISLGYTATAILTGTIVRIALISIGLAVTIHVARLRNLTAEMLANAREQSRD